MFPDVLFNTLLFPTTNADTIAFCPETATEQGALGFQYGSMDSNRAFAFQVPANVRDAYTWAEHSEAYGHDLASPYLPKALFHAAHTTREVFLPRADELSRKKISPAFRDDNYMVLAFLFNICLTLPILHWRFSLPFWGLPRVDRLSFPRWVRQSLLISHRQSRWFSR